MLNLLRHLVDMRVEFQPQGQNRKPIILPNCKGELSLRTNADTLRRQIISSFVRVKGKCESHAFGHDVLPFISLDEQ